MNDTTADACRRCGHLQAWHTDPGNACHGPGCQCEAYRLGPVFPEHEKLTAIAAQSQAQGELLDWLRQSGRRLMRWHEWDEEGRHHEDWVPDSRSIEAILAEFHGIDMARIDAEKRAMLAQLRGETMHNRSTYDRNDSAVTLPCTCDIGQDHSDIPTVRP